MQGLCECGCGLLTSISARTERARGFVAGQHRRFVQGHNGRNRAPSRYITPDKYVMMGDGCWEWAAYVRPDGYGAVGPMTAHRKSYEEHVGPIPVGMVIDHLCRNRLCVNPDHLEPVTAAENARRGDQSVKLNAIQARSIAADPRLGYVIAADYGVTGTMVSRIKSGRAWSRATGIVHKEKDDGGE